MTAPGEAETRRLMLMAPALHNDFIDGLRAERRAATADVMHEDRATAPSGTCRHCGLHVAYLLGIWTDDDGTITCLQRPGAQDHEPTTPEGEQ